MWVNPLCFRRYLRLVQGRSAAFGYGRMHALAALLDFGRIILPPFVFDVFQPLNLASPSIDPVTVDCRAGFGIATAFGVMIFAENELKVRARRLFGDVRNTIP